MTIDVHPEQTHLSDRVAEEIRALLARRRVSGRELSRRLGVSPPWVSLRLTGSQEIGLNDLERIAAALGVTIVDLLPRGVTGQDLPPTVTDPPAPRSPLAAMSRPPGRGVQGRRPPPGPRRTALTGR